MSIITKVQRSNPFGFTKPLPQKEENQIKKKKGETAQKKKRENVQ
jgi:hypothetical protein